MKINILFYIFSILILKAEAQTDTLFWFAAPEVSYSPSFVLDRPIMLQISTGNLASTVTISQPAGSMPTQTVSISANSTQTIDLTSWIDSIECKPANTIKNYGLKISASSKITVYYEINASGWNPELFLLKGTNALGTSFFISSQNVANNATHIRYTPTGYSSFNIVATENNTTVTINPSNNIVGHSANTPFSITLNKGQTYAAIASSQSASLHLGSSTVNSNKPIAITLSDDLVAGGPIWGGGCNDLIGDQTIPVNLTGTEYIAQNSSLNSPYDKIFIQATQNNTNISINGNYQSTIGTNQTFQYGFSTPSIYISTNNPVYVFQVSGIDCELGSAMLPPINCTGSFNVSFIKTSDSFLNLNLLVKSGGQGGFKINGSSSVATSSMFSAVPGTGNQWYSAKINLPNYLYSQNSIIKVSNSTHYFHLGVMQGNTLGYPNMSGASFGYFSNFNRIQANAYLIQDSFFVGDTALIFADSVLGATYSWTGPNGFTSNVQNPFVNNLNNPNFGKYVLAMTVSGCGTSYDTVEIFKKIAKCVHWDSLTVYICVGKSYLGRSQGGVYVDSINSIQCDTIRKLKLFLKRVDRDSIIKSICTGESFRGKSVAGIYRDTFTNTLGCDSIIYLDLTISNFNRTSITKRICFGSSYSGYNTTGTYSDTFQRAGLCDSIRILYLTVMPKNVNTIYRSVCSGKKYGGHTAPGNYLDTFQSYLGCDSFQNLILSLYPDTMITKTIDTFACRLLKYNGTTHTFSTTRRDTLRNQYGCDSIQNIINITITNQTPKVKKQEIIFCDSIWYHQRWYHQSESFNDTTTYTSKPFCDSMYLQTSLKKVDRPQLSLSSYSDFYCYLGDKIDVTAHGAERYRWSTAETSPQIVLSPTKDSHYYVKGWNQLCEDSISFQVKVYNFDSCHVFLPNSFTPNGDLINDSFQVFSNCVLLIENFEIYNRWGEKVFKGSPLNNFKWNGVYKNTIQDIGVYVYVLKYRIRNTIFEKHGSVNIIR